MTSEPDSKSGRRPPTIELKATEIGPDAAAQPSAADGAERSEPKPTETTPRDQQGKHVASDGMLRHGLSALIGAVVVAAAAAALWFASYLPAQPSASSSNDAAIHALVSRLNDIQSQLRNRVPAAPQADPALAKRLATAEAQTQSVQDSLAALSRRLDGIATNSQDAGKQASVAAATAAEAKISSQTASETVSHAANQASAQTSDLDALSKRIVALEGAVKTLAAKVDRPPATDDRAARLSVVAEALRAAVESGRPYQPELAAVQSLAGDEKAAAPLQQFAASGVPSAAALAHQLEALAPNLRHGSEAPSGGSTILDRLEAHARNLVQITPVDAPPGNEPSAVIARIEIDARHADIAAALNDIAALPEAAKPLAADWVGKAKAREAAIAASRKIAAAALANLSKPASQ